MALKDFNSFVEVLQKKLVELDETIPELPLKDIVREKSLPCTPNPPIHLWSAHYRCETHETELQFKTFKCV